MKFAYRGTECEIAETLGVWYGYIVDRTGYTHIACGLKSKASAVRATKRFIDRIIANAEKEKKNG